MGFNLLRLLNAAILFWALLIVGCAKTDFKVKVIDQGSSVAIEISNFSNVEKCFYSTIFHQVHFIPPQPEPKNLFVEFDLETSTKLLPNSSQMRTYAKAFVFSSENLPIERYRYEIELYPCGLGGYAEAVHMHRDKRLIIVGEGEVVKLK